MVNMVIYLFELFIVVVLLFICIRYFSIEYKKLSYNLFYKSILLFELCICIMYEDCFVEYFCRF